MEYKEEGHDLLRHINNKEDYDELISKLCIEQNVNRCLHITSKQEYEALIATGWPLMFMFVGEVWGCPKNPIFELAYFALAEELKDNVKLVTVDMAGYDQPARYWVENFTTRAYKSEFDKAKPIWDYFSITFYHREIIDQHQDKEFSQHRATALKVIDKVRLVKKNYETFLWKEPEYIYSSSWEIDLNKARKPIVLYFQTDIDEKYCKLRETKGCIQTISHVFKNDIDFYMLKKGGNYIKYRDLFNLYEHFNITETPYILAVNFNGSEWVESGRIKPLPYEDRESERFKYDEVHNFCANLIKDSSNELLETPELLEINTKEQLEIILLETKKPVYIYLYNNEDDDFRKDNIQHAMKTFRKLQIQYKNKITFCQIDSRTCKHAYQPLGGLYSNTFLAIFNDCLYGPVYCHQETGLTPEEVVEHLEKIAKELSEEEYLPIEGVLELKKLDAWYNKPCFLAFYTSLEAHSMSRMKKFNSLYKQYKDKVDFIKVESTKAFQRHKLTKHDLPAGGCTRKEMEETYRKMVYLGTEGDLNDEFKIYKFLPTFVGYFQGTLFDKIGFSSYDTRAEMSDRQEVWDLMEKQVALISEIKPCTVPKVEEIEYLDKYYDQGKPLLFFFHTEFTPEISNQLERINSELEGKVTLIRITRGGPIYEDFDVLNNYPAFCAVWNREKIKKIDNSNQSDKTFNTFWAQSGEDVNALVQKLKKLADKYPVQIKNIEEEEKPKENVVTSSQDEIVEKMTKLCLNFDSVNDMDESLVTHKGELKKLLDFRASWNGVENMYLGVLYSGHRDIRLREKKVSATLYIKPYPQELLNFTNEKMYQIVLYDPDAKYYFQVEHQFRSNESTLGVNGVTVDFDPITLYPWRIKKEGNGYVISNPYDKVVLCCYYFEEENIFQLYVVPESQVIDQIKVFWTFEKSEGKKAKEYMVQDEDGNYVLEAEKTVTYNSSVLDDL